MEIIEKFGHVKLLKSDKGFGFIKSKTDDYFFNEKKAEEKKIQQLRNLPENVFAVGDFIRTNKFDGWVREKVSGLNTNVRYVHNKFMLIDPR